MEQENSLSAEWYQHASSPPANDSFVGVGDLLQGEALGDVDAQGADGSGGGQVSGSLPLGGDREVVDADQAQREG
ncbi:hypothetical protein GCM10011581_30920 [Saccharopolyspora subtropica]|uniref:Uncharacterized protein n=1 Tax=Saccharopolyspora thermophila TaxID=89367 RepID=A0A917JXN6_9PSEU|nr:hypothetical protein [Saccharopolyspora subtropica]GGI91621.1 hypothetical protein GCM10011581_30920 [Saccharopolyspora subtropica]